MKVKPKFGCDLDGVCYPFDLAARTLLHLRGSGVEVSDSAQYWNHTADLVSKEEWEWIWNGGRQQVFDCCAPYPGVIEALHKIEQKARLVIITHRPRDVAHVTMRWLARYKISPYALIHSAGEVKSVAAFDCIGFVEDRADNCREIAEQVPTCQVFAPRRGWNRDLDDNANIKQFDDWNEVVEWVSTQTQTQ